ncbi:MAG: DUF2341 domain-containing protein [Bacteroidales bacterium]|nr:DUF2341 domain-containing protein [Bacteroidales bacterium]
MRKQRYIIFYALIIFQLLVLNPYTYAQPCLSNFSYRALVQITNNSGQDLTDEPVRIVFDSDALISQGKMNANGFDLRFMNNSQQEYQYWLDKATLQTSTTIAYVKIPSITNGQTLNIYMFYGSSGAPDQSDGEAVFTFFDEFEGSSLDASKWNTCSGSSLSVLDNHLNLSPGAANSSTITTIQDFDGPNCIEMRIDDFIKISNELEFGQKPANGNGFGFKTDGNSHFYHTYLNSTSVCNTEDAFNNFVTFNITGINGIWKLAWNNSSNYTVDIGDLYQVQNPPDLRNDQTMFIKAHAGSPPVKIDWFRVRSASHDELTGTILSETQVASGTNLTAMSNAPLCNGDDLVLSADPDLGDNNYEWYSPNNTLLGNDRFHTISMADSSYSGTYRVVAALGGANCNMQVSYIDVLISGKSTIDDNHFDQTVCSGNNSGSVSISGYSGSVTGWIYSINGQKPWQHNSTNSPVYTYANITEPYEFRAIVQNGVCPPDSSGIFNVYVDAQSDGGTLDGDATLCQGGVDTTMTLTGNTGDIVNWQFSTDNSNWDSVANTASTHIFSPNTTTWWKAKVKSGVCPAVFSNTVKQTVNPQTQGGSLSGGGFGCTLNNTDTLILSGSVGNVLRWESAPTKVGPWSVFNQTDTSFVDQALVQTRYYQALVQSPGCNTAYSEIDSIVIDQNPVEGSLSGDGRYCETDTTPLKLSGYSGTIKLWQFSDDNGASWKDSVFNQSQLILSNPIQGGWYRTVIASANNACPDVHTDSVKIDVDDSTRVGSLVTDYTDVCELGNEINIRLINSRKNQVEWKYANQLSGPWISFAGNDSDSLTLKDLKEDRYISCVVQNGECAQKETTPDHISVSSEAVGGILTGSKEICELTGNGRLNLTGMQGSITKWEYTDNDTNWYTIPHVTELEYDFDSLLTTRKYRVLVENGSCPVDTSTQATIIVNPLPDVNFSAANVNFGDPVEFNNLTTIQEGSVQSYFWDFGNEESSMSKNPKYVYPEGGKYNVKLTATSANKFCVDSFSADVTVYALPDVDFTFDSVCLFVPTKFTNTTSGVSTVSTVWDFGDGSPRVNGDSVSHMYDNAGFYNVKLIVGTVSGGLDSISQVVPVYKRSVPDFMYDNVCASQPAVFDNSTIINGTYATWDWTFGNGSTSLRSDPQTIYNKPGTYLVTLRSTTDYGCTDSITKRITVFPLPVAGFQVDDVPYQQPAEFIDTSKILYGALNYAWQFGDADTSMQQNPVHEYISPGIYTVTLTVTSDSGCSDQASANIQIFHLPEARFEAPAVCWSDSTRFNNTTSITAGDPHFYWNFGDGNLSEKKSPTHLYQLPGSYTVRMICVLDNGARDTVIKTVQVYSKPEALFNFNEACDGWPTQFNNQSTTEFGSIVYQIWDFDDGSNSLQLNPEKQFLNAGNYEVSLVIETDKGCTDTIVHTVPVHENPVANFTVDEVCIGAATSFTNRTIINSTLYPYQVYYNWDLNDGNSSTAEHPYHQYDNPGMYRAQLKVNTEEGCYDSLARWFEVYPLPNAYAGEDSTVVKGYAIYLQASGGKQYEWSPNESLTSPNNAITEARPMETTTYAVRVVDTNSCINSDSVTLTVKDALLIEPSNIVTPNTNNENDTWYINNIDSYPESLVEIFDRRGHKVYSTTDYQNTWNGVNDNGDILPDGTYYYIIHLNSGSDRKIYRGAITVLRDR